MLKQKQVIPTAPSPNSWPTENMRGNDCYFKLLGYGVICYTAIDNIDGFSCKFLWKREIWQSWNMIPDTYTSPISSLQCSFTHVRICRDSITVFFRLVMEILHVKLENTTIFITARISGNTLTPIWLVCNCCLHLCSYHTMFFLIHYTVGDSANINISISEVQKTKFDSRFNEVNLSLQSCKICFGITDLLFPLQEPSKGWGI